GKAATDRPLPYATLRVRRMIGEAQQVADQLERIAFDGTIDDTTTIYSMAGADDKHPTMTIQEMQRIAAAAGYRAVERDTHYNEL
ncbi:MAG: hypothetical protein RR971_05180, partial [Alistipes sp.]